MSPVRISILICCCSFFVSCGDSGRHELKQNEALSPDEKWYRQDSIQNMNVTGCSVTSVGAKDLQGFRTEVSYFSIHDMVRNMHESLKNSDRRVKGFDTKRYMNELKKDSKGGYLMLYFSRETEAGADARGMTIRVYDFAGTKELMVYKDTTSRNPNFFKGNEYNAPGWSNSISFQIKDPVKMPFRVVVDDSVRSAKFEFEIYPKKKE
ncbi:MAG TPA: hypothetical protein VK177_18470 [Flavobacteriales bacterium]|nr:hypothetical protein [Flavobacteriales bacterium]